jgi:hypothetical protein
VSTPAATGRVPLVDAATLAAELGCSVKWVYEHSELLAPVRLGSGPRARLRFDPLVAREALSCLSSKGPTLSDVNAGAAAEPVSARRRRRMPNGLPPAGSILASRPQKGT